MVGLGKVTSVAEDRAELEPGTVALRVRRADHSATLPVKSKKVSLRASKLSISSGPRDNARASGPLASPFACDSRVTSRDSLKRRACLQAKEIWALSFCPLQETISTTNNIIKISLFKFSKKNISIWLNQIILNIL